MALDNIDIDVNNGLETANSRSVDGTVREKTQSDAVELTEDEKRSEIMNSLINNQKYHNMLEVCTRLKIDLNRLIIMNMDPTELSHLTRNNVESVVEDALESTRKFISDNTTGLVLRTDGTINVAESIAEAVDRGGIFDNSFVSPEITSHVREMYEERLEKLHHGDNFESPLLNMLESYTPDISFENNRFRITLTDDDVGELNRIYRTYGKAAVERELIKRAFETNRKDIVKHPDGQYAYYIKNELRAMEIELRGVTDINTRESIISLHTKNINALREHITQPELYLSEAEDGTIALSDFANRLIGDEKKNEIELIREFKEIVEERKEAERPLSYATRVEGMILACIVCDGVNGLEKFQKSNLDQLANLCPQLVESDDKGNKRINEEELKHHFEVLHPELSLEGDTLGIIKRFCSSRTTSAIGYRIDYALNKETNESKLLEVSKLASSGDYEFNLSSLDTIINSRRIFTRTEIINTLESFGNMITQMESNFDILRKKYDDETIDEDYVRKVLEQKVDDPRFDKDDLELMERAIMPPNAKRKYDVIMTEWMNSTTFRTAFSSFISKNEKKQTLEINYEKVKEEYNKNKASVEINGRLVSQEEIRRDLYKRLVDYKNKINGKTTTKKSRDRSYSSLSNLRDEELIKIVRENMPIFYNSITMDTSRDSIECLSMNQLMPKVDRKNEGEIEGIKRLDYRFLVDGKYYNALGIAKLFNDSFKELKKSKKWKDKKVSMNHPIEELLDEIPEKRDVIELLIATKGIMEDAENFELFSSYYENDSNAINIGRLQRLVKQMEESPLYDKSNYEPQQQYTILGRSYSKLALVSEYLDIKNFENDKDSNFYKNNEKRLKLFEEQMKSSPEFERYIDSEGNIDINLLRIYKGFIKRKIKSSQFGFSSRPDDVIVKIGDKEYKQLDIPSQIVKLTRSQKYEKNKAEIDQLLKYIIDNPDLYGKELIDTINGDGRQKIISAEFVEAAMDIQPKYTVDKAVFTREEIIRLLAEKHMGGETEENTRKYELYKFHNTKNAQTTPIKLAEAMVIGKYGKDFKDILCVEGQMASIDWDKLMEEYLRMNKIISGRENLSKNIYSYCNKNYTPEGLVVQVAELSEKLNGLNPNSPEALRLDRMISRAYKIMTDPKNFEDFGKYNTYESDNIRPAWIKRIKTHASLIKQDKEKLAMCQPIDDKSIKEHFKTADRDGDEVRLFELKSLNEVLDKIPVPDPEKEYGHKCKAVRNNAKEDEMLRRAQDIKIYGSRLEIAERIYKEISAQAYSRRVFNKDEFIVSTLLDVCDNLKEKDPELAKFLVPGITERISTNMTRYQKMETYDPDAQDIALGTLISEESFERLFKMRNGEKLSEKAENNLLRIKNKVKEYKKDQPVDLTAEEIEKRIAEGQSSVRLRTDKAVCAEVARRVENEIEISAKHVKNITEDILKNELARQAKVQKAYEITDAEGKRQLGTMSEDMAVDVEGQNKALLEMAKGKQEDLSERTITDEESKTALASKEQSMIVADQPQLDSDGKKIEGQESETLGKKDENQSISNISTAKENQSSESFETVSTSDGESSDTTSSESGNVHQESENGGLPAKDNVFNRIKRGFFNFINNITGKGGKEKEVEDNSLPAEDKKASDHKENQETVMDFNESLQVEGVTGKLQTPDLNVDNNRTGEIKNKNTGNSSDRKADDQEPEQEM